MIKKALCFMLSSMFVFASVSGVYAEEFSSGGDVFQEERSLEMGNGAAAENAPAAENMPMAGDAFAPDDFTSVASPTVQEASAPLEDPSSQEAPAAQKDLAVQENSLAQEDPAVQEDLPAKEDSSAQEAPAAQEELTVDADAAESLDEAEEIGELAVPEEEAEDVLPAEPFQETISTDLAMGALDLDAVSSDILTDPVFSEGFTCAFDESTGVLTIQGSGSMADYGSTEANPPWKGYTGQAKQVVLQEGITSVGAGAFHNFAGLEKAVFPSTLQKIGYGAFAGCKKLKEVSFSEGLTTVEAYAFQDTVIEEAVFPSTLADISPLAFFRVGTIKSISVSAANPTFFSEGGILFSKDGTRLVLYPAGLEAEAYYVPQSVTAIEDYAFYYAKVGEVVIPPSVTRLGEGAFFQSRIKSLTIPDSVTQAGYFVASECAMLTTLRLGAGLKELPYSAFENCYSLKTIVFAPGIEEMGRLTFARCIALEEVTIPEGVKHVANGCFGECTSLRTVHFPSTLEEIWYQAFFGCTSLQTISLPPSVTSINRLAFYKTGITEVALPSGITHIGKDAFPPNTVLHNLPQTLTLADDGSYRVIYKLPVEVTYDYESAFQVLEIVNRERAANNLPALAMDEELLDAAMLRAAETSVFFSHTRPTGLSMETVSSRVYGENIACRQSTAAAAMSSWMSSDGHRENILGEFASIGVGAVIVGGQRYWVQCFGLDVAREAQASSHTNRIEETWIAFDFLEDEEFFSPIVDPSRITVKLGQEKGIVFGVAARWSGAIINPQHLVYESSDPGVCAVSAKGEVEGKAPGTATVRVSLKGAPKLSAAVDVTVKGTPAIPRITSAVSKSDTAVRIAWEKIPYATSYNLYYKTSKKDSWKLLRSKLTGTAFTHKKLKTGKTYWYAVEAVYKNQKSGYSAKGVSARPLPSMVKISGLKKASGKGLRLSWKKVNRADGYIVYVKKNKKWVKKAETTGLSYVDKNVKKGKTFAYKVRAYKIVNKKKVLGPYSSEAALKYK